MKKDWILLGRSNLFSYLYSMNYKELAEKAQAQIEVLTKTVETLQHSLDIQSVTMTSMAESNKSLLCQVANLESLLLKKDNKYEKMANQLNGLSKIVHSKKTERRNYVDKSLKTTEPAPTPKERGNNGAKRKVYDNLEEVIKIVEPTHPEFIEQLEKAKYLFYNDVIRYELTPPKLRKIIYRCNSYRVGDKIYEGKAPISPFLNSNFDSSVIANLMQLRYVYGMPVERVVKYMTELGMDIPKPTAHNLIAKGAELLDRLAPVLRMAILSDSYIHFDETYHQILDKSLKGSSRKGYLWVALAHHLRLINYYIDKGATRGKNAFTDYVSTIYQGAIQTDGLAAYKVLEGWEYKSAIRLGCIQHCKRKFLEIDKQPLAKEFIDIYNEFYIIRRDKPKDQWIEKSEEVIKKLEARLREVEKSPELLVNKQLSDAVKYSLNELDSIRRITESTKYQLDNNAVERPMRYISTSRKNSMFCGSIEGAKRTALIYSLAISCRMNNVNSFSYFCDVLNRLAQLPPNLPPEKLRSLLPDQWTQ